VRALLAPLLAPGGAHLVPEWLLREGADDKRTAFIEGHGRTRVLLASMSRKPAMDIDKIVDDDADSWRINAPHKIAAVLTVCAEYAEQDERAAFFPCAVGARGREATCRAFVAALVDEREREHELVSALEKVQTLDPRTAPGVEALRSGPGAMQLAATFIVFALWAIVDFTKTWQLLRHAVGEIALDDALPLAAIMFTLLSALAMVLIRRIEGCSRASVDRRVSHLQVALVGGTIVVHLAALALLGVPLDMSALAVALVPATSFAIRLSIPTEEGSRRTVYLVEVTFVMLAATLAGAIPEIVFVAVIAGALALAMRVYLTRVRPDWTLIANACA